MGRKSSGFWTQIVVVGVLVCWCAGVMARAQEMPELPRTDGLQTCMPDLRDYRVITVGPVGRDHTDLQEAIDAATPQTVIKIDSQAVLRGTYTLRNKGSVDGWIIITSNATTLPKEEQRVTPTASILTAMPTIISDNTSGQPCFTAAAGARYYRLVGLHLTVDTTVTENFGIVMFNSGSDFIVDRCYIHGHDKATVMKAGVLLNCANSAVICSHISQIHSIGFDTYAIGGTNGPGPFKIINNYLEAAGENILFGGAAPTTPGLVPSDIEVLNNHFTKPWSWRVGHPSYAGRHWTIKNLFELKTGQRVLVQGNLFENCWADLPIGQSGYAILLTVRGEGGKAPQATVSDITIRYNVIRHVGAGISLSGSDGNIPTQGSRRILIAHNFFTDVNGPAYGDGNTAGPNDGTFIKLGDPEHVTIDHNTIEHTGPITWAIDTIRSFRFTNNLVNCFLSEGGYQGMYGPGFARGGNGPMARYFPGVTDANQLFHNNVLVGGPAADYSNYATVSKNYFPASRDAWSGDADIGANLTEIADSMVYLPRCVTVSVPPPNTSHSSGIRQNGSMVEIDPLPHGQLAIVQIIDVRGMLVHSFTVPAGALGRYDLSALPRGIHVVRVVGGGWWVVSG
jgi:hypothetical protein